MKIDGLQNVFISKGTFIGKRFGNFVEKFLLPILLPYNGINPFSVVVMDNASIHYVESVVNMIEDTGTD